MQERGGRTIGEADGIPYLSITDEEEEEGQGLKNEGSKRRLPIHPDLIQLGFLTYVDSIKTEVIHACSRSAHMDRTGIAMPWGSGSVGWSRRQS